LPRISKSFFGGAAFRKKQLKTKGWQTKQTLESYCFDVGLFSKERLESFIFEY